MNELPSEAKAFLELTRSGHGPPGAAARERVRQRIAAAIAGAAATGSTSDAAASQSGVGKLQISAEPQGALAANPVTKLGWARGASAKGALFVKLTTKFLLVAGASALVGATLLSLSRPADLFDAQRSMPAVSQAERARVGTSNAPAVTAVQADRGAQARGAPAPERVASATIRADPAPGGVVAGASARQDSNARSSRQATSARARSRAHRSEENLAAELTLLHHAADAIAAGDAELGLSMLQAYRARFARPRLQEERAGLIALARCTLDAQDARPARSFVARHPSSVLSARVRQACALGSER